MRGQGICYAQTILIHYNRRTPNPTNNCSVTKKEYFHYVNQWNGISLFCLDTPPDWQITVSSLFSLSRYQMKVHIKTDWEKQKDSNYWQIHNFRTKDHRRRYLSPMNPHWMSREHVTWQCCTCWCSGVNFFQNIFNQHLFKP